MAWVYSPDGRPGQVPDENLEKALSLGYTRREPTPDEMARANAAAQPLRAGLEGAVRGATFGFAEPLIVGYAQGEQGTSPEEARQQVKIRKQENPIAEMAGNIAGGIGLSALTGGGASALVGGGIKGAAFEGGLYGLGSMAGEATLDDTELTAQKAAAGVLGGALAGGGTAGAFKLLGKGVSAGVRKLGGMSSAKTLQELGSEVKWSTLAQANKRLASANEGLKKEIVDLADNLGVNALDEQGLMKVEQYVGPQGPIANEYGAVLQKMDASPNIQLDKPLRKQIADRLQSALHQAHPTAADTAAKAQYIAQLKEFVDNPNSSWQYMKDWQARLFSKIDPNESSVAKTLREGIKNALEQYADQVSPGLGANLRRVQRDFAVGYGLQEMLANRVASMNAKGPFNVGSLLSRAGMGVGAAVGGLPGAVVGGIADDVMQKRGGFILGNVLQTLGKSPTLNNLGNALYKRVGQMLLTDPALLGPFRIPIEQAFARGADALLATHLALGKDPNYLATMGMTPETTGEVEAAGQRMAHTDALVNAANDYDASLEGAVDGMLGTKPGRKAAFKSPKTSDFKERLALIQDIARDPDKAFEGVPGEFFNSAPNLSGGVAGSVVTAAKFLADKAPKSPYEGMPEALKQPWKPSDADLERWYRYVDALDGGPARLLQLAAQGALTREHIEATQAVYPRLYDDLRNRLMERLSSWEKPLPYSTKVSLSQFFGPQVLGMSPGAMQVIQQSFSAGNAENPSGGMSRPDGRQQVSQEKNLVTQAQRIEGR